MVASGLPKRAKPGEYTSEPEDLGFLYDSGTPARVQPILIFKMIVQPGDPTLAPFSFMNDPIKIEQVPCYLTYTNEATMRLSERTCTGLPSGVIEGVGARYCPSIEDNCTFSGKEKPSDFWSLRDFIQMNTMYGNVVKSAC